MKILAFAASNSATSINKALVTHSAQRFADMTGGDLEILDLNDFEMPIFSPEREAEGYPPQAQAFLDKIAEADRILISFAEHNGNLTAAYKNTFDWASRLTGKVYEGKPMVLLATSPGGRGGLSVLQIAEASLPRFGADVRGTLSVPKFGEVFDREAGVLTDPDLAEQLSTVLNALR